MFTQRSGSVASYAAVAVAAAIVSVVGTWSATQFVASSAAQPGAPATGQPLTHSTARRSPRARSAHKPFGSRAGGEQCSASAPGPPYVWRRDRGDVRICNQRRAKSPSESRRYILRAAYRDSLHISKSKHRQACKNSSLHGCRPEEPEHGCRIDCGRNTAPSCVY